MYQEFFFAGREVSGFWSPSGCKDEAMTFQGRRKDLSTVLISFSCTKKWGSLQGIHSEWGQGALRGSSSRLGTSIPIWQSPLLVPPEHFDSDHHLLPLVALVPLEKSTRAAEKENDQELLCSRSTGCEQGLQCKISDGLWTLWCSWEELPSTARNVPPVIWELMMLEMILWGKISA